MLQTTYHEMENILLEQTQSPLAVLHGLVAKQLKMITGAAVCAFSRYDADERALITTSIEADALLMNLSLKVLGKSAIGLRTPISDDMLSSMRSKHLSIMSNLTEATQGAIPFQASLILQAMMGLDRFIGLAFLVDGQVYGTAMICMKKGMPAPPEDMLRFFASMTAISIRGKQDGEKLNHYLHHDELTGLYNRRHFIQHLSSARNEGVFPMTLMMMDVDNLKKINDQDGHLKGDEALVWTAKTITGLLPEAAVFARLGGDEFALLIQNHDEASGLRLLERMRQATCDKGSSDNGNTPHLSIGMAFAVDSNENLQDLLHLADMRMYS